MPEAPTSSQTPGSASDANGWLDHPLSHLASWRAHQCARAEAGGLAAEGELDRVLSDIGLTRSALPAILAQDPDSPDGLRQMAARLGIAPQTLALAGGQRDLQRRCRSCEAKEPCQDWLSEAEGPEAAPAFCPNAADLARIRKLATALRLIDLF